MQTLVIDTYKVVTRLQQKGFSKDQAEALVSAAQEIDLSAFVTKNDPQQPQARYDQVDGRHAAGLRRHHRRGRPDALALHL